MAVGALMGLASTGSISRSSSRYVCSGSSPPGFVPPGHDQVMVVAASVALVTAAGPAGTGLLAAIVAGWGTGLANDKRGR